MSEDQNRGGNFYDLSSAFSLMRELQYMLHKIARTAELNDASLIEDIRREADIALKLVDSFLMTTRAEFSQMTLDLSPMALGSVMHQVAYEIRDLSGKEIEINAGVNYPVMANKNLLKNLLFSLGYFISNSGSNKTQLCSFRSNDQIGVGVFAKNFDISAKDLRHALSSKTAHMPMSSYTNQSAVMLVIADVIAKSMGSKLAVKKLGKSKGFSIWVPKSEQLSLV